MGSLIGGLSSLLILLPCNSIIRWTVTAAIKLAACFIITISVFYTRGISKKKLMICSAFYMLLNAAFGGIVYLIQSALNTKIIYISGLCFYFDIPLIRLVFTTGTIYIVILIISHMAKTCVGISHSYMVTIDIGERRYRMEGVSDTGNTVTDIFSGRPVIICTGCEEKDEDIYNGKRITAVPYSTVNGEGLLYAFTPDALFIENEKGEKICVSALVAFTKGNVKRAVFNPGVLV